MMQTSSQNPARVSRALRSSTTTSRVNGTRLVAVRSRSAGTPPACSGRASRGGHHVATRTNAAQAIAGIARVYLKAGQAEQAKAFLEQAKDSKDPEILGLKAALELAEGAPTDIGGLRNRIAADARDFEAWYDLGRALAAQGETAEAIDALLEIVKYQPDHQAARDYLVKIFTAVGNDSPVVRAGRRRLSSMLFS